MMLRIVLRCAPISAGVICAVYAAAASAQEAKPLAPATPKITYDDHIRPIFREHCLSCHGSEKQESGLRLDTYQKAVAGGSSGEVVIPGDLGSSRLWALVSHKEEPQMPPKQDQLAAAKLDLISKWIEQGAQENAGSKITLKRNAIAAVATGSIGKPAGPIAMPVGLLKQPVLYTQRPGQITALASSPGAPLIAVAGQKQVAIYNSDDGQLLGVLPFPEGIPYILRFSRNGSVLLAAGGRGGHSGCVVLFDAITGKRLAKIGDELDAVLAADINSTHTLVALGGPNRVVRIYSAQTGELVHELRQHTDWIDSIEFSPDGRLLATADRSGGIFVWEADTAREHLNLRGHSGAVCDVSWRLDSKILATAGEDATIKLWELNDGNSIKSWTAHAGGAFCVRFAHDGRLVSSGRDNTVKTWGSDGTAQKSFPAFAEAALRCAFTQDGQRVVGGDWLGNVKVWDAAQGGEVFSLAANPPTLVMRVGTAKADLAAKQVAAASAAIELAAAMTEGAESIKEKSDFEAHVAAKKQAAEAAQAAVKAAADSLAQAEADKRLFDAMADKLAAAAEEALKKAASHTAQLAAAQLESAAIASAAAQRTAQTKAIADQIAALAAELAKAQANQEGAAKAAAATAKAVADAAAALAEAQDAAAAALADQRSFAETYGVK